MGQSQSIKLYCCSNKEFIHEGSYALYCQVSKSHFWLLLASNWLKFYCDVWNCPYHDSLKVTNIYHFHYFGKKINTIHLKESVHFIVMHQKLQLTSFGKIFNIIRHEGTPITTLIHE